MGDRCNVAARGLTPTRLALLERLACRIELGYYIDSDDGQPNPCHVYCGMHARLVAERMERMEKWRGRGTEFFVFAAWAGSDHEEWCAITTCGVALNTGPLTDHGIDSALALTEEDPFSSPIAASGLVLAAESMGNTDPRWPIWDRHALEAVYGR